MSVRLADIPGAFHIPRPNWDAIQRWLETNLPEPDRRAAAWNDIAHQWLETLNEALGGGYRIKESEALLLVVPDAYEDDDALMQAAEYGLASIVDALGAVACQAWRGPLIILLFAEATTYALYVSPDAPDDEYLRSGAVCVKHGYVHVALRPYPLEVLQRNLLHEMTHACLSHLSLPVWLEEGITQMAEEAAVPAWGRFTLDTQSATAMRRYWQTRGLADFWWGQGFWSLDESQGNSYLLAQIIFRLLVADHKRNLPDFVAHAQAADAGDSAARQYLGKGLAAIAAQFLGPGSWEPVPPNGNAFHIRGVFYLERKEYDRGLRDLTEAVRLDSRNAEAFTNRGVAHHRLGLYAEAQADFNQAIELNPYAALAHHGQARLLATCPEDRYRDGDKALAHALRANELYDGNPPWFCLDTLAAAHAEVGDFAEAQSRAKQALRIAPEDERAECKERLNLYRQGRPCRETPGKDSPAAISKRTPPPVSFASGLRLEDGS